MFYLRKTHVLTMSHNLKCMNKSSAKCKILNKVMVRKGVGKVSIFRQNEQQNYIYIYIISKNTSKMTPEKSDEKCDEKNGPRQTPTHGRPGGEV